MLRWSMMGDNLFSHEEEDNTVLMRVAEPSVGKKSVVKDNLVTWGALSLLLFPLVIGRAAGLLRQEKTFDTTSSPHIGLSNFIGHVVVKGWDRQQVHVLYGTTSPQVIVDVDQLPPQGPAEKIHITTRLSDPKAVGVDKTVFYSLDVPLGANLEIRNSDGRVDIEKLQGDASVDSSAAIISVSDVAGRVMANSIDGNIEILRSSGKIEATSICGNLHFVSPTGSALKAQTTSGKIVYEGDFVSGGDYTFRNYSGDIDLFLPPSASFELNKTVLRGKFLSEIPTSNRPQKGRPLPGAHTFLGSNVSSTAAVRVSSYSGNVHIHRQP